MYKELRNKWAFLGCTSQALLQTSGMLKCEGVMNFDLVGQNLTMSGLIIAIIGKKNWSEVWLRGFITHEPRYPWCDIIISTKPSPRSLILVCSINWRISQWMYLMMKKTKIPVCRLDETYIYILYWTATVSPRCPLREVRDKSNIWTISRAGYLSDGLIEKLGFFFSQIFDRCNMAGPMMYYYSDTVNSKS